MKIIFINVESDEIISEKDMDICPNNEDVVWFSGIPHNVMFRFFYPEDNCIKVYIK